MAEEAVKPANGETVTPAPAANGAQNNTPSASEGVKPQGDGAPKTVPYERFKEVNDQLQALKGQPADKPVSPPLPDSPVDTVLDLVGKVPEHLKPQMKEIARYAAEHKMPVDDVINLWNVKTGNMIPKADVEKYHATNQEAANSGTGGSPNPAARHNQEVKAMSDADLKATLEQKMASGESI